MTKIEWTDVTWNPITGCTPVSEGCKNCYAERMARRLAGRVGYPKIPNHFKVTVHWNRFFFLNRWKKPRRVFVCSMGDLFHSDVPYVYPDLWTKMISNDQHIYQILTKRAENMFRILTDSTMRILHPQPNIWIGVTAENIDTATLRIPWLLQTPSVIKFVSVEPILGPVDLSAYLPHLDWVICGGETGPGARAANPDWVENLLDQCTTAGVPFFFKGWGDWYPHNNGGKLTHTRIRNNPRKRILAGTTWDQFPPTVQTVQK